ncbi:response regulator transcription factor [Methylobacterium sp. E-045]|uniref:response regulator transcription factor n=1 Tax=Methylobacterium sp. E-045 TaxID=2836575 RepID=UPI001FBA0FDF|nr:response regulator transcription factor [Methylobacterium sp. E-045]MCJ2130851.1 response regulator transcription factor [Methylobacterium sp. E-045]
MNQAVGVLIIDEPMGLGSVLRAFLEHEPSLHTVSEADLPLGGPGTESVVALVFLSETASKSALARITALKRHRGLRVLAAFQSLAAETLRSLLEAGADAMVAQSATPREISATIVRLAHAGAADTQASGPVEGGEGLTPREAEILRFLSAGFSNKEVARRLSLSVRTVETHRLNLRRKTQTGRLKDLVCLARQLGLAPVVESETPRPSKGESGHHGHKTIIETMARH